MSIIARGLLLLRKLPLSVLLLAVEGVLSRLRGRRTTAPPADGAPHSEGSRRDGGNDHV